MGEEAVKMEQEQQQEEAKVELEERKLGCPGLVLFVDLHCSGCAKKIEKCVMRIRGVEGVGIDMAKNEVSIKGIVDDPHAVCDKITKKTNRLVKLLSSSLLHNLHLPHQLSLRVVELNVNMHCEACAHQLKKKILKMRGVQTASTEFSTGKVMVTGTMDENKLVDYVYRRTKKQATIIVQPQPQENKQDQPPPEAEAEPKLEAEAEAEAEAAEIKKTPPEPQQGTESTTTTDTNNNKEEQQPKPAVEEGGGDQIVMMENDDDENMKRNMMYQSYYQHHPLYVIQSIPPPQLFSDENPNACCILSALTSLTHRFLLPRWNYLAAISDSTLLILYF